MMVLTKKRVATIEALAQRFGTETVTRSQIMTALDEGVISAFPYWMTDDLTLKVSRGEWHLPTPDEFTVAGKGDKATKPATKRTFTRDGKEAPSFLKAKVEKPAAPAKEKKSKKSKKEVITDVVAAPVKTKKSKKVTVVPTEPVAETVTATV